jgi:SAM-dependent methyltransferase
MYLELGSGLNPHRESGRSWKHADQFPFPGVDFVGDFGTEEFWQQFHDDSIDWIKAQHVLEHVAPGEPIRLLFDQAWCCLKPDGVFEITVPRFPSDGAVMHLDHKSFWTPATFSTLIVPAEGKDKHGFFRHFWHIIPDGMNFDEQNIHCLLTPNKSGMTRFEYTEVSTVWDSIDL